MGNNFIGTLLHISLSVSVVIILFAFLSPLLRKRYRAGWRCLMWLAVSLRLLIPVNISFPNAPIRILVDSPVLLPESVSPSVNFDLLLKTPVVQSIKPELIIPAIWAAGVIYFILNKLISYLRFKRRVKYAPQMEPSPRVKEIWKESLPELKISSAVSSPIITGFIKPLLFLPHEDYSRNEMEYIFRHELVHYKQKHIWIKLLLMFVNGLHWFNPFVYLMADQAGKDIEMYCDDCVKAGLDDNERALYGRAILDALPVKNMRKLEHLTSSFGSVKKTIKSRLINLFDKSAKKKGAVAFCAALTLIITASGLVVFIPSTVITGLDHNFNTEKSFMLNNSIQESMKKWFALEVGENRTPVWHYDSFFSIEDVQEIDGELDAEVKPGEKIFTIFFSTTDESRIGSFIFAYGEDKDGPYLNKLSDHSIRVPETRRGHTIFGL